QALDRALVFGRDLLVADRSIGGLRATRRLGDLTPRIDLRTALGRWIASRSARRAERQAKARGLVLAGTHERHRLRGAQGAAHPRAGARPTRRTRSLGEE